MSEAIFFNRDKKTCLISELKYLVVTDGGIKNTRTRQKSFPWNIRYIDFILIAS